MSELNLDYYEKVICHRALFDSTYLASIVDYVEPKRFKDKHISKIFTIIKDFHEKRNKLPTITELKSYLTTDELKDSFKNFIVSIKDIDKNIDRDELIGNTERYLKERAVYHTMLDLAETISKGEINTSEALSKFEKACNINLSIDNGIDIYDDINLIIDDLTNVEEKIPSTWEWLDNALDGGFIKNGRALYVFAGETNIGKSIFLGNIASNIASQGKNVLLISLEMSELIYARRLCTNISQIPLRDLATNTQTLKQVIKEQQANGKGKIFIKEFPPATITPNQIKSFTKKLVDTGIKIDAIVIDYLNLLHSTIGSNSYERIKSVTEQVRALSYVFNCPVISATQLNRNGFNSENPELNTISESIGLAATADVIVSIFQNEEDRELNIIRLGMMKNRYGPRGHTQSMRIDYPTLTITQADSTSEFEDDSSLNSLAAFAS